MQWSIDLQAGFSWDLSKLKIVHFCQHIIEHKFLKSWAYFLGFRDMLAQLYYTEDQISISEQFFIVEILDQVRVVLESVIA